MQRQRSGPHQAKLVVVERQRHAARVARPRLAPAQRQPQPAFHALLQNQRHRQLAALALAQVQAAVPPLQQQGAAPGAGEGQAIDAQLDGPHVELRRHSGHVHVLQLLAVGGRGGRQGECQHQRRAGEAAGSCGCAAHRAQRTGRSAPGRSGLPGSAAQQQEPAHLLDGAGRQRRQLAGVQRPLVLLLLLLLARLARGGPGGQRLKVAQLPAARGAHQVLQQHARAVHPHAAPVGGGPAACRRLLALPQPQEVASAAVLDGLHLHGAGRQRAGAALLLRRRRWPVDELAAGVEMEGLAGLVAGGRRHVAGAP
jgi:hypothetical protein